MKMNKLLKPLFLSLVLSLLFTVLPAQALLSPTNNTYRKIDYFDSFEGNLNDASIYDWTGMENLLYTLEFGTDTIWPDDEKCRKPSKRKTGTELWSMASIPGLE